MLAKARYHGGPGQERMVAFKARALDAPQWPRSAWAFEYWKAPAGAAR